jgi:hypothetical protein
MDNGYRRRVDVRAGGKSFREDGREVGTVEFEKLGRETKHRGVLDKLARRAIPAAWAEAAVRMAGSVAARARGIGARFAFSWRSAVTYAVISLIC